MRLLRMTLRNFKGVKEFTLEADGRSANVYGDNATGKTTLADAFTWVLFGKDSSNRASFEIKTLMSDGRPQHGLDHSVEVVLEAAGQRVQLLRVYHEKWTKKRGAALSEFTGHETEFYVDGVPVSKGEYERRVAAMADESIFRLLTSPTYFSEQMKWEDRRRLLLDICGDITDVEVINSEEQLANLASILSSRSLEDHRKIALAQRSKINKELENIPIRIDEVTRSLPDTSQLHLESLDREIASLQATNRNLDQQLARIEGGGEIADVRRQISELQSEILTLTNAGRMKADEEIAELRRQLNGIETSAALLGRDKLRLDGKIGQLETDIKHLDGENERLRAEWRAVADGTLEFSHAAVCPTCGQVIPAEQIEQALEKAQADFNQAQATKLEAINKQGKANVGRIQELQIELIGMRKQRDKVAEEIAGFNSQSEALRSRIDSLSAAIPDISAVPEFIARSKAKAALEVRLQELATNQQAAASRIRREVADNNGTIAALQRSKAQVAQREQGEKRIAELKEQERKLAAEFERIEHELHLTELFVRTKVSLLEERINGRFRLAKFKLFAEQVNGGLAECCEATYDGVPYGGGLNNAARINIGIDIINALSEHYGFSAPIFVDNREAVTELIPTSAQVISLIVSAVDKTLRTEVA